MSLKDYLEAEELEIKVLAGQVLVPKKGIPSFRIVVNKEKYKYEPNSPKVPWKSVIEKFLELKKQSDKKALKYLNKNAVGIKEDSSDVLDTVGLNLRTHTLTKNELVVSINGIKYAFKAKLDVDTPWKEIVRKYLKIKAISDGKALAYLKKIAVATKIR